MLLRHVVSNSETCIKKPCDNCKHTLKTITEFDINVVCQDSDVVAEREKIKNGEITDEHVVVIRNLIKVLLLLTVSNVKSSLYLHMFHQIYPRHLDGLTLRERKVAVRGITLAIPKGECFGLLGTNGTSLMSLPVYPSLCCYSLVHVEV